MADNYIVKDGNNVAQTFKSKDVGAGLQCPQTILSDTSGNPLTGIQGVSKTVAVVPTVTVATYAASKVIGGIMTFASILPPSPFGAVLESLTLKFKGSLQTVGFYVALFTASPAGTFTDTTQSL